MKLSNAVSEPKSMITKLRLERFKNFRDADITLGGLTTFIGPNACGKSNLRDAFRVLHAVGRGYSVSDIFSGKWGEGGERLWTGIRGGAREAVFRGQESLAIQVDVQPRNVTPSESSSTWSYRIEIDVNQPEPRVVDERFSYADYPLFEVLPVSARTADRLVCQRRKSGRNERMEFSAANPVLSQIESAALNVQELGIGSMRFFEFDPEAMREPSAAGQTVLGDRGQNLSSVLHAMCKTPKGKRRILDWLSELTPSDVVDVEFTEFGGKLVLTLVEADGGRTPAWSASDGTLRFLGLLAALWGPNAASFNFIEELENGIHPTRLRLLVQMIEQRVSEGHIQVVVTTHSPRLLSYLGEASRQNIHVISRVGNDPDAHVYRIYDLPDLKRLLAQQDLARLFESGWFEDAVAFSNPLEATA